MVEQAQAGKAGIQRLADRICAVFVPAVLACTALTLASWLLAGSPAVIAFYGLDGRRLSLTNGEACDLVMNVAAGQLDTVDDISAVLRPASRPRR